MQKSVYFNGACLLYAALIGLCNGHMQPTSESCSRYWLKMTDSNYIKAVEHFENCAALVANETDNGRDEFVEPFERNMEKSWNYFLFQTKLPTQEVERVVEDGVRLMQFTVLGDPMASSLIKKGCAGSCGLSKSYKMMYLYYGFIVLIALQLLGIFLLVGRCCWSDDLLEPEECSYGKCRDRMLLESILKNPEAYYVYRDHEHVPLLEQKRTEIMHKHAHDETLVDEVSDEDVLEELSILSTSSIGSESEIEALINRKQLPKSNKRTKKRAKAKKISNKK